MSFQNMYYHNADSHLNPCSEPNIQGCGKFMKVGMVLLSVGILAMGVSMYRDKQTHATTTLADGHLQHELEGIKNQIQLMKENVQFIIKAKKDTNKMIEDINKMFREIRSPTSPATAYPCTPKEHVHVATDTKDVHENHANHNSVYRHDESGLPDYALESSGGSIVGTPKTVDFDTGSTVTFFGWLLCKTIRGPRSIIQPSVEPGECWAFKGSSGSVLIKLLRKIHVSGVSLEHIPKSIAPGNDISSAPNEFSVYGIENLKSKERNFLGRFAYKISDSPMQYFQVTEKVDKQFDYLGIDFHSNHGNEDYTCVYRVRVHGSPSK